MNPRELKRRSKPVEVIVTSGSFRKSFRLEGNWNPPFKATVDTGDYEVQIIVEKKVKG